KAGWVTIFLFTETFPSIIKLTASLREVTPQCAKNLFKGISERPALFFSGSVDELFCGISIFCCGYFCLLLNFFSITGGFSKPLVRAARFSSKCFSMSTVRCFLTLFLSCLCFSFIAALFFGLINFWKGCWLMRIDLLFFNRNEVQR